MLGAMRIIGVGRVFERVLFVVAVVMRGFIMAFGGHGCRRDGLHRCSVGGYRGVGRGMIMGVIVMMVVVFVGMIMVMAMAMVMRMAVIMRVRLVAMIVMAVRLVVVMSRLAKMLGI